MTRSKRTIRMYNSYNTRNIVIGVAIGQDRRGTRSTLPDTRSIGPNAAMGSPIFILN